MGAIYFFCFTCSYRYAIWNSKILKDFERFWPNLPSLSFPKGTFWLGARPPAGRWISVPVVARRNVKQYELYIIIPQRVPKECLGTLLTSPLALRRCVCLGFLVLGARFYKMLLEWARRAGVPEGSLPSVEMFIRNPPVIRTPLVFHDFGKCCVFVNNFVPQARNFLSNVVFS